jgi:DNA polymerase III subunit delta
MRFSDFRQYRPKPEHQVFIFVCDDDVLLEESRNVWGQAFGGEWLFEKLAAKEFEEIPASRLMDHALTPSLFSQSRAFIVTNSEKLTKGRLETLAEIHAVANSSMKVILAASGPKSIEALSKTFPVVEIDSIKPADAARWLIDRHKVSADVARYLVETLGTDLRQLTTEIEKLQTYVGPDRPVEVRDVDVLILRSEQFGPFELDDAVLAKDYRKAVQVLGAMLEDGVEPLMILARIVRIWRQLFVGKALVGKKSAKDVAMAAGAPVWKANEFAAGCRKHDWKRVVSGFRELLNADRAFKSSADPEVYFDVLLWKLIG